jgi:hypothetical protein
MRPHDKEAVWQLTDTGLLYVVEDPPGSRRRASGTYDPNTGTPRRATCHL